MKKRKKWPLFLMILLMLLSGTAFWYLFMGGKITGVSSEVVAGDYGTRSLIVYFSRIGEVPDTVDAMTSATPNSNQVMDGSDTEAAAKMIQELTGADLYQIRTEKYYRKAFWGTAATAWIEEKLDLRPGLAAQPENLDDYDVIYVGYPIWWFNTPMAVGSFLESYDLTGKTIVPFCTSADNDIDVSMDYIRKISAGADVLEGYRIHNSDLEDVAAWLERIHVLEQVSRAGTKSEAEMTDHHSVQSASGHVTPGTEEYHGFIVDNVFHSTSEGDIHYNIYIPESYDGTSPYALYVTLPGYEGLYFQGVASNIKAEAFGFEAQKYNNEMIIAAPQLNDWGETSASQTIVLVEYFLEQYNIDPSKVYGSGFSGGGETMSQVVGKRPDLFTAYLQVSSQWDGAYEPVAAQRLPVYFVIGGNDEYYGPEPTREAYDILHNLYVKQGLSEEEIDRLLVLDIKEHDYFTERNMTSEHSGGGLFAYDENIMGWLFSH
ncbi:MAG: flavodoxin [Lachnospiraceae bacterium]